MILILRGHIRDAFNTQDLKNLIADIYHMDPTLEIYIHTWNVFSNGISWRAVGVNLQRVTTHTIHSYFGELSPLIKHMIIEDDADLPLLGNVSGVVASSGMPIRGWKNYWYGKYQIIQYIQQHSSTSPIINTRFDVLNNSNSFDHHDILQFIDYYKNTYFFKNQFMPTTNGLGMDNLYMGNLNTMYTLIHHFAHHLDEIETTYRSIQNQELLVPIMNERLFPSYAIYIVVLSILILYCIWHMDVKGMYLLYIIPWIELFNRKRPISEGVRSVTDTD